MGKWMALGAFAVFAAAGLTAATARPVSASCDGPIPSFREFAAAASRIVIGRVTAVDSTAPWRDDEGRSSRFTLRIDYVVRGESPATMEVRDAAFLGCADHIVIARVGDEIALAFDVPGLLGEGSLSTIPAWVKGTPMEWGGAETITVREVFSLVGKTVPPATSTDAATSAPGSTPIWPAFGVLAAFLATAWVQRRRRPSPWRA
jgi:MYXO-CTERM domain-containing protein